LPISFTVAEKYSILESGLFGVRPKISNIADKLNVQALKNRINTHIVKAVTVGLNLQDIFDFYQEIDNLRNICPCNCAAPYPMTGYKSPTIFICRGNKTSCEGYEKSFKAIHLIQQMDDLEPGKYTRCLLITPRLLEFYMCHYSDIKETT